MLSFVNQKAASQQTKNSISSNLNEKTSDLKHKLETNSNFNSISKKQSISNGSDEGLSITNPGLYDFSRIPIFPSSEARLQTKLKINAPGDKYEQEADKVAEQVMRMPEQTVQRKCDTGDKKKEMIQTKSRVNSGNVASSTLSNQIQSTRGSGQVMDANIRSFMEPRFGMDFSGVRIHADSQAVDMSQGINARAFTIGKDIYFNRGAYNPSTKQGNELLTHELAHVLQQRRLGGDMIQKKDDAKKKEASKKKDNVKTKVDVVTEHDFSKGKTEAKASITRSVEQEVTKGVTASASEKAISDSKALSAAVKVSDKKSGLYATGGIKAKDPADPAKPQTSTVYIKVGNSWKLFNSNLKLSTSSALEYAKDKGPKLSVDGKAVFFPNGVVSAELAASFALNPEGPSGSIKPGLTYRIIDSLSAKAGVSLDVDPNGKLSTKVGVGLVFSF